MKEWFVEVLVNGAPMEGFVVVGNSAYALSEHARAVADYTGAWVRLFLLADGKAWAVM